MKTWAMIVAVVGFVSATVGLIQAFSFDHLATVECHHFGPRDNDSDMLDCLHDLEANAENVVMLDWHTYAGAELPQSSPEWRRRFPFERRVEDDYVGWQFEGLTFASEINRACAERCDWDALGPIEQHFSNRGTSFSDIDSIGDNGMGVRIRGSGQSVNPFSSFEIETEGSDIAQGPYQISMSNRDAHEVFWLSPAPMTDRLAAQVRCAERDWPAALKFFVCPFA